jgi:transcriptional regulatory protein RtcR
MAQRRVVIGFIDPEWDGGDSATRWQRWRPSVAVCQQPDLPVARYELLVQPQFAPLADEVAVDIRTAAPDTDLRQVPLAIDDPWDFEEVYGVLHDYVTGLTFDPEAEDYLVHMSTGTHVTRICLFLLTEARYVPGRLLQTYPGKNGAQDSAGGYRVIDLDLSRYDRIAQRFAHERVTGESFLKAGIATRNPAFNRMIAEIEQIAIASTHPILLTGPTGAGKSQLAQRVYELKHQRHQVKGEFVPVNCATLRGEGAMSALFGHRKGAFTGAVADRSGLLRRASQGVLFLDEIGELGAEEQAMLLRALDTGRFYPVGGDKEEESRFQLFAGTNRTLADEVRAGRFREDLLARINLWTYRLPGLRERAEDIEPNLDYELERFAGAAGRRVSFNREARRAYLAFATAASAAWRGNFRDLNASVTRMATLAPGGRITTEGVEREIGRLRAQWAAGEGGSAVDVLAAFLSAEQIAALDRVDQVQLREVIAVCRQSRSIAEAGRRLFQASRVRRRSQNDSDRVRKLLARFGLDWQTVRSPSPGAD